MSGKVVLGTADNFRKYNQKLKDLKREFEISLKDEQETVDKYNEIADSTDCLNYESAGRLIRSMARDEERHAQNFNRFIKEIDGIILSNEKEINRLIEEERKKSQVKEPNRRYGR